MAKFRLKKGQKLGALSAESDVVLNEAFLDTGYLDKLLDTEDPTFLILGRTGSGKTALVQHIKKMTEYESSIDPEELSMQYLHSNPVIKTIANWGIHLDIFFKYLWRHVCILELIKLRYPNPKEGKKSIFSSFSEQKKAAQLSLDYLEKHGNEYWITADTHIKDFTSELETKISKDANISIDLGKEIVGLHSDLGTSKEQIIRDKIDKTSIERTQAIVNDYQISALNEVLKHLGKHSFNDSKKKYLLLIDDLDKNWMPNDIFYLTLIKSLLYTVKEVNQKLSCVKIIVALRTNIYYRLFRKSTIAEPQREKWRDVLIDIKWDKNELIDMVNKRLSVLFKDTYTKKQPLLNEILPSKRKKTSEDAIDYILERTFFRPRDVIEFMNILIEQQNGDLSIVWSSIFDAESEYSKNRLNSILDEWKDSFFGISSTFELLKKLGRKFSIIDIMKEDVEEILVCLDVEKCKWLASLQIKYLGNFISMDDIKIELVNAWHITGMIGIKKSNSDKIIFSYEKPINLHDISSDEVANYYFHSHKLIWKALGINSI